MRSRTVILLTLLLAGWPVLRWYELRVFGGSDERWGILALLAALVFAPWRRWRDPLPAARWPWLFGALAVYVAALPFAPPLVRALLFVATLAIVGADRRAPVAWGALLFLSLPVVASAQFFAGYPLRVLTTQLTVPLIALLGQSVEAVGTTLHWRGEQVVLDAPCSGIQMLWTGLLFSALAACWFRLDARACLRLLRFTGATVFVANVLRAVALFFFGTGLWPQFPGHHAGVGLVFFGAAMLLILFRAEKIGRTTSVTGEVTDTPPVAQPRPVWQFGLIGLFMGAGLLPLGRGAGVSPEHGGDFPGWQTAPIKTDWTPHPMSAREASCAESFPGRMNVYTDGESVFVVRWVDHATRRMHPGADCLRALGFSITPGQILARPDGSNWSTASAANEQDRLVVRERIVSADGQHAWTDVSAWFWHAALRPDAGPWWMITELSPGP